MSGVLIAGVGMTQFGKHVGAGLRKMAVAAIDEALVDADIPAGDVTKIFFGNAVAGTVLQQESIRGQVALRHHVLSATPVINVENACASGGSAFNLAYEAIAGGREEVVLVVGAEQLNHVERARPFNALRGSMDIDEIGESAPGEMPSNSILMDFYAGVARDYLERTDATPADFAAVAVKNRNHGALNPLAHLRKPQTIEEVLASRMIVPPLTLPMCSPVTDGACAIVLCGTAYARRLAGTKVAIEGCEMAAAPASGVSPVVAASRKVYAATGQGPRDFDLIELHDAAAPAELMQYEEIGLVGEGEAHHLLASGATALGGKIPVNVSGGLLSRGHPLGATGCAQLVELVTQLRGRAGERQVAGVRLGLAINCGGWIGKTYAVSVATVLRSVQ